MYLVERLNLLSPGNFIEIGPGAGDITQLLLSLDWSGTAYDLDKNTITLLNNRFSDAIKNHKLSLCNEDFISSNNHHENTTLILSCMVMERMEDDQISLFMEKSASYLQHNGIMIGLVPSSPAHWGIEDDIAGHCRRYTRQLLLDLVSQHKWKLDHVAGLTFPLSNLLLPISNYLVNHHEQSKLGLSALERTKQSGRRNVKFKTHFPDIVGIFLNKITLLPFHWLQKFFRKSERSLVLYFEAKKNL